MKEVLRLIVTLEGTEAKMQFSYDADPAHALGLLEVAKRHVHVLEPVAKFQKTIPLLTPKRF